MSIYAPYAVVPDLDYDTLDVLDETPVDIPEGVNADPTLLKSKPAESVLESSMVVEMDGRSD